MIQWLLSVNIFLVIQLGKLNIRITYFDLIFNAINILNLVTHIRSSINVN